MSGPIRFEAIADLDNDYVLGVPEDARPKDVIKGTGEDFSTSELWRRMIGQYMLLATDNLLLKYPSDRAHDTKMRYYETLFHRLAKKRQPFGSLDKGFSDYFADSLTKRTSSNNYVIIQFKSFGETQVSPAYIFEKNKIELDDQVYWVLFQPSKYLKDFKHAWALKHLVGESTFTKALKDNYFVLNGALIESLIAKSDLHFYLSSDGGKIFSAPLDIHKGEHGPLRKIAAKQALTYLSIPALERLIERGSAKLANA